MINDIFTIQRLEHNEQFLVNSVKWNLYSDVESKASNFCLFIECKQAINISLELQEFFERMHWELNVVEPTITEDEMIDGFVYQIPKGYDESREGYITNLYFFEHQCSDNNQITILKCDGSRKLIRLEGEVGDINHYDESKPKNKLSLETWFEFDPVITRSMK